MAYGERYSYVFWWDNDDANNKYKVSFLKDGYAGSVDTLVPTENPFTLSISGQKTTIDNPIFGSEAKMGIRSVPVGLNNPWITIDAELLESDYKDYIIKLIQDPDGTPIVKWVGFMLPENSSRNYSGYEKVYRLRAVDGLADLKNKFYSSDGTKTGSRLTGFADMLTILKTAISKVADISEFQLDFRIQLGTFSDQMTSTENAFKENEIVQELFSTEVDGEIEFDTCYEVIKKILTPFYCGMAQSDGYYWIFCNNERESFYFEYDWATLTQQSRTANTRFAVSLDGTSRYDHLVTGNLYKQPALKSFEVTLFNKDFNPELIINGGFDANITGWTNGDADDSSNAWTNIQWDDFAGIGGTLEAAWGGAATAAKYNFHSTAAITLNVTATAEEVQVTYKIIWASSTPAAPTAPKVKIRLWNVTDGYTSGSAGQKTLTIFNNWYTFTETFSAATMQALTVSNNFIDIEVEVVDATTTVIAVNVDDIAMTQANINNPTDFLYRSSQSTGSQTKAKELDVYIGDQPESVNDICAIKDSGGNYTTSWNREGKTDATPLIYLFELNVMNDNATHISYIKTTVKDPSETAEVHDLVFNRSGVYARIVAISKNYGSAEVSYDVIEIEVLLTVSDLTLNQTSQKLNTKYGEAQN